MLDERSAYVSRSDIVEGVHWTGHNLLEVYDLVEPLISKFELKVFDKELILTLRSNNEVLCVGTHEVILKTKDTIKVVPVEGFLDAYAGIDIAIFPNNNRSENE